jgi:hypothetical protein
VTPLAIPTIVTPWGVTAILFFAALAFGDSRTLAAVIGILLLVMLLNLVGMMLARQIISRLGMMTFQVLGWIFAVLQAGLAVDAVVSSLRNLALFRFGLMTFFNMIKDVIIMDIRPRAGYLPGLYACEVHRPEQPQPG